MSKQLAINLYSCFIKKGVLSGLTVSMVTQRPLAHEFKPWPKGVSSFTLPHYLWKLLSQFCLISVKKWP